MKSVEYCRLFSKASAEKAKYRPNRRGAFIFLAPVY